MMDIKSVIAQNISELRIEGGMTQLELAERLHYSDKAVSKWERGESVPEISTLKAISELFGVTLDYLVSEEHTESEKAVSDVANKKEKKAAHTAVTAISVLCVACIATLVYILIDVLAPSVKGHWLAFICAVPLSAIVWLVFNSIWFNKRRNYFIISILMWGVLLCIHLSLLCAGFSVWQVYLLGVPGQIVIILWSCIRPKKRKN